MGDPSGHQPRSPRRHAGLFQARLNEANLSGANLRNADLNGADLSEANLDGVDWHGAKYTSYTKWPIGFEPDKAGTIKQY